MFVQTQITPNPNSLKFIPGKKVSNCGSLEITNKDQVNNDLVRNYGDVKNIMCHFPYFRRRKRDVNEGFGYGYYDKKCFFFSLFTDRSKKTEKKSEKTVSYFRDP